MAQDKPSVDTRHAESDNQATDPSAELENVTPGKSVDSELEAAAPESDISDIEAVLATSGVAPEVVSQESPASDEDTVEDVAALKASLEEASSVAAQSRDDVLRIRAEMENLRKRQARELENAHKYALDKIALELLPVRDTLEMGVAAAETDGDLSKVAEGTGLTLKMLTQALEKFNVVEVDPQGDKFDPDLHQAISVQEGTDKPA